MAKAAIVLIFDVPQRDMEVIDASISPIQEGVEAMRECLGERFQDRDDVALFVGIEDKADEVLSLFEDVKPPWFDKGEQP
jgi:hypothetical protein